MTGTLVKGAALLRRLTWNREHLLYKKQQGEWRRVQLLYRENYTIIFTSSFSSNAHNVNSRTFSSLPLNSSKPDWLVNSLIGRQLSFRLKTSRPLTQKKHFSPFATISFSHPTAKPEKSSTEETPKWSARAIKSFAMGELEARKLKYPNTGTEALLMGILVEV